MAKAKRTVVFLHGLGGSKADFAEVAGELKSVAVFATDLPGSGSGPKPESGYDPPSHAAWLAKTLDQEGLGDVVLVGQSVGARVAGELAAREPARISGLGKVSSLIELTRAPQTDAPC